MIGSYLPLSTDDASPAPMAAAPRVGTVHGPPRLTGDEPVFTGASIHEMAISADEVVRLGFGKWRGRERANAFYFVIDVMAWLSGAHMPREVRRTADGRYAFLRKGSGFRIVVEVITADAKFAVDLATATSAVKIGAATARRDIRRVGGVNMKGYGDLGLVKEDFGPNFMTHLRDAITALNNYLATASASALNPQNIALIAAGGTPYSPANMAWTHILALEGIYARRTIQEQVDWIQQHANYADEWRQIVLFDVLQDVYEHFGIATQDKPTQRHRDIAWRYRNIGRY